MSKDKLLEEAFEKVLERGKVELKKDEATAKLKEKRKEYTVKMKSLRQDFAKKAKPNKKQIDEYHIKREELIRQTDALLKEAHKEKKK